MATCALALWLCVVCLSLGGAWSLRIQSMHSTHSTHSTLHTLSMSTQSQSLKSRITIKVASDTDIPLVARFLSEAMYGPDVPNGQRKELARLELIDLRDRYGSMVGRRKFPAALIVAEEDEEVVGCVGLDCQLYDKQKRQFGKLFPGIVIDGRGLSGDGREVAVVLSNLAVRVEGV
jgi:hypothetical protein